ALPWLPLQPISRAASWLGGCSLFSLDLHKLSLISLVHIDPKRQVLRFGQAHFVPRFIEARLTTTAVVGQNSALVLARPGSAADDLKSSALGIRRPDGAIANVVNPAANVHLSAGDSRLDAGMALQVLDLRQHVVLGNQAELLVFPFIVVVAQDAVPDLGRVPHPFLYRRQALHLL